MLRFIKNVPVIQTINRWREDSLYRDINEQQRTKTLDLLCSTILQNIAGLNREQRSDIVVSLTSYSHRVDTVFYTLVSMLNQTVLPKRIILWLSKEEWGKKDNLPKRLLQLELHGIDIRLCDDYKSYKKLVPTILAEDTDTVITVDDDVFYPCDHIEKLLKTSNKFPECIIAHMAHKITLRENGSIKPYVDWEFHSSDQHASFLLCPIGFGGVLYKKALLYKDVTDVEKFMLMCPDADDLWFKTMALLKGIKTKLVEQPMPYRDYIQVPNSKVASLWSKNKFKNDIQFISLLDAYPKAHQMLLSEHSTKNR